MTDGCAIYLWLRLLITGVPVCFLHIQQSNLKHKPSLSLQFVLIQNFPGISFHNSQQSFEEKETKAYGAVVCHIVVFLKLKISLSVSNNKNARI